MPLAQCPDCNREVSTRARQCVHCGRPWPAQRCGAACAFAVAAIVAVCVFTGLVFAKARACSRSGAVRCKQERVLQAEKPVPAPTVVAPAPAPAPQEEE